jgi:hypothetical protein
MAILSEDRFLARVGMSTTISEPAFGGGAGGGGDVSIKGRFVNLVTSVRTLLRSKFPIRRRFLTFCEDGFGSGSWEDDWEREGKGGLDILKKIGVFWIC